MRYQQPLGKTLTNRPCPNNLSQKPVLRPFGERDYHGKDKNASSVTQQAPVLPEQHGLPDKRAKGVPVACAKRKILLQNLRPGGRQWKEPLQANEPVVTHLR